MNSIPTATTRSFVVMFALVTCLLATQVPLFLTYDPPSVFPSVSKLGSQDVLGVGDATRGASVGIRTLSGSADEIAQTIGRSRVTISTPSGRYHFDLRGRAHFDKTLGEYVTTPHVRFDTLHVNPSDPSFFNFVRGPVQPATWQDIRIVQEYLRRTGQL